MQNVHNEEVITMKLQNFFFFYKTFFCLDFLFFRLLSSIIFCPLNMITIASFVRPAFTSSLMDDVL